MSPVEEKGGQVEETHLKELVGKCLIRSTNGHV